MNNELFLKIVLSVFAITRADYILAGYSGRHPYENSDPSNGLGFFVICAIVLGAIFLIGMIQSNNSEKQSKNNNKKSSQVNDKSQSFKDEELQYRIEYAQYFNHLLKQEQESKKDLKQWIWIIIFIILVLIGHFLNW